MEKQKQVISLVNEKSFDSFTDKEKEFDLSDGSIISLVSLMQESIFKVRLMNSLRDVVYPLVEAMGELQNQKQLNDTHHHQEDVLYQQSIITAIENMKDSVETSLIRTLVLEYRQFTRNPVWSTFRLLNAGLIKPVASAVSTIMFGWKKTKSDTDRIVESIDKLREFMMTGQVDKQRSMFEKIIQGGLVGVTGRIIGAGLGITQSAAQSAEDKASRGEKATFREQLSKRFISDIIQRGRNDYGYVPDKVSSPEEKAMLIMFSEDGKEMKALYDIVDAINRLSKKIPNIIDVTPDSTEFDFYSMFRESKESPLYVSDLVTVGKLDFVAETLTDQLALQYKASNDFFKKETETQTKTLSVMNNILKNDLSMNDVHEDTERYGKKSLRELQGIRRTQIYQALMSTFANIGMLLKNGISSIMGGLKSVAAAVAAAVAGKKVLDVATGATELLPDKTNNQNTQDSGKKKGKFGKAAAAGVALGGLVLSGKAFGDDTDLAAELAEVVEAVPAIGSDLRAVVDNYVQAREYAKSNGVSTASVYFGKPNWLNAVEETVKQKTKEVSDYVETSSLWNSISEIFDNDIVDSVKTKSSQVKDSLTNFYDNISSSIKVMTGKHAFVFDPKDKTRDPMYDFNKRMGDFVFNRKEPLSKEWFDQKIQGYTNDFKATTVGQTADKWVPAITEKMDSMMSSLKTDWARFGEKESYVFDPKDKTRDPMYDFNKRMGDSIFMRKEEFSPEWFEQKFDKIRSDFDGSAFKQTFDKWVPAITSAVNPDDVFSKTIEKWEPVAREAAIQAVGDSGPQIKQVIDSINSMSDRLKEEELKQSLIEGTQTGNDLLNDMKKLLEELNKNIKKTDEDVPPLAANIDGFIHRTLA